MKAVRFHRHGGPEVLRYEDAPDPVPAPGQAVVRVRACALNHLDLFQRRGMERVTIPFPHISGADIAGEVAVVHHPDPAGGATVAAFGTTIEPGTRVMLQPGLSCGRCLACLEGRDNECPHYDVLGYQSNGGYAEYVCVPVENLVPIPEGIDFVTAAAFPLTFLTAWHMLVTRASLRAGETVLVLGAGSGVGQAAIQIAVLHGARVIATVGSDDKLAQARALGATAVVNHTTGDVPAAVRAFTHKRGADVVVEHVGTATWERSIRSLARGGRLVTCGATTGYDARLDLRVLFSRQIALIGSYMGRKGELLRALPFLADGTVAPAVDRTYPLADAAEAQRRLEARAGFGKIVLVA